MKRATGTRFEPQRLLVLAVALAALASCDEALISGEAAKEKAPAEAQDTEGATELFPDVANGSQRDVEAPDVFDVTEAGLWDGRPSLGGIWVAHPDAKQPERVLIKNAANNKSVTGALFRRERDLPGPALQVSSSAAEQLGMLAGSPARLQVVALRREQVKAPPPVAADPDATAASDASDAPETAGAEADPAAETAQETTQAPAKRKWWQKKNPENTGAAAAGAAAAGAAAAGASAADDSAAAATQSAPSPSGQSSPLADPTVTPPAEKPAKKKWWQKKKPEEITETPLDPIESAAAAIETAEPTAAEVAAGAAAAAPAASSLTKPYIQIGTFSVEANANSAADKLRKNGMAADVLSAKSGDKNVWRVVVGPATTRADRKALLQDVKDLGFQDAFTASN